MRQKRLLPFVTVLLLAIGCQLHKKDALNDKQKKQVKEEVSQVLHDLLHPGDTLQLKKYLSYYQLDSDAAVAMDGYIIKGKTMIRQYLEEMVGDVRTIETRLPKMHIRVVKTDVAIVSFLANEKTYFMDGEILPSQGSYQLVFQKIDGQWKIIASAGAHVKE